jgi:hypothetical protein
VFDQMPVLADALQDAGCDNTDILNHCRQPGEHVRGCWVVDLLTGRKQSQSKKSQFHDCMGRMATRSDINAQVREDDSDVRCSRVSSLERWFRGLAMNEAEWLAATDPTQMMGALWNGVSDRKLRLLAVAWCRVMIAGANEPSATRAVEASKP